MSVFRRFGILVLGIAFLAAGFYIGFTPVTIKIPVGAIFSGTYKPVKEFTTGFPPIALTGAGGWLLACIIVGTALVAGWFAALVIGQRIRSQVGAPVPRG